MLPAWSPAASAQEAPLPEDFASPEEARAAATRLFEQQDAPAALALLRGGSEAWPEDVPLWTTAAGFLLSTGDLVGLEELLAAADRHGQGAELAPWRVTGAVLARLTHAPWPAVDPEAELAAWSARGEEESLMADSLLLVDAVVRYQADEHAPGAGELVARADRLLTRSPPSLPALQAGVAALTLIEDYGLAKQRIEEATRSGLTQAEGGRLLGQIQLVEAAATGDPRDRRSARRTYARLEDSSPTARAEAEIARLSCRPPPDGDEAERTAEGLRGLRPELDETWRTAIDATLATLASGSPRWILDVSGRADLDLGLGPAGPRLAVTMTPVAALLPVAK